MSLLIPHTISNGINADGNDVGSNFDAVASWANATAAEKTYVDASFAAKCPTARFTRTTDTLFATSGLIVWEAETNDLDGWGAPGSSTLTCPADGLYAISAWVSATGSGNYILRIQEANASTALDGTASGAGLVADPVNGSVGRIFYLKAGAQLQVQMLVQSGSKTVTEARLAICKLAAI